MINIIHQNPPKESIPKVNFPKLMINDKTSYDDIIVLFSSERIGTIVGSEDISDFGYYSQNWNMSEFSDYNLPITIQNKIEYD